MGGGYEIISTFFELGFPSAPLDRLGLGRGFEGSGFKVQKLGIYAEFRRRHLVGKNGSEPLYVTELHENWTWV